MVIFLSKGNKNKLQLVAGGNYFYQAQFSKKKPLDKTKVKPT